MIGKSMRTVVYATVLAIWTFWLSGCAVLIAGGAAATAVAIHDRRTLGTVIEDQNIEMQAHSAIRNNTELHEKTHINVTSYNTTVLLTGEAPTQELRARAETLVKAIPKVTRVHNEIQIAAPSALTSRSADTMIGTRVKTSLAGIDIEDFDMTRVKVVTEDGTVYLMGLLTREEADAVVEKARHIGGVQRVVKVLEYLD